MIQDLAYRALGPEATAELLLLKVVETEGEGRRA